MSLEIKVFYGYVIIRPEPLGTITYGPPPTRMDRLIGWLYEEWITVIYPALLFAVVYTALTFPLYHH